MVKHASVGGELSRVEWEADETHIVRDIPAGYLIGSDGTFLVPVNPATILPTQRASLEFTFGDGVETIDASEPDQWIEIPFSCNIISVRLTADAIGTFTVDIWKDTYAAFPPTDSDSITGSNPPVLSSALKSENNLSGWIINITAGDWLKVHVDSAISVKRVVLSIGVNLV